MEISSLEKLNQHFGIQQESGQYSPRLEIELFKSRLNASKKQIEAAIPTSIKKHITPDRVIRLTLNEFRQNPLLQKCSLESIFLSVIQASQLGLEVGLMGQAFLVPRWNSKKGENEATMIIGYRGLIELIRRTGQIESLQVHTVYKNDTFDLELGLNTKIQHKPMIFGERGAAILYYGIAKFKNSDGFHFEYKTIQDIQRIRAKSSSQNSSAWRDHFDEMAKKTVLRYMAKFLPSSIELAAAMEISAANESGENVILDGECNVIKSQSLENEELEPQNTEHKKRGRPKKEMPPENNEFFENDDGILQEESLN